MLFNDSISIVDETEEAEAEPIPIIRDPLLVRKLEEIRSGQAQNRPRPFKGSRAQREPQDLD